MLLWITEKVMNTGIPSEEDDARDELWSYKRVMNYDHIKGNCVLVFNLKLLIWRLTNPEVGLGFLLQNQFHVKCWEKYTSAK